MVDRESDREGDRKSERHKESGRNRDVDFFSALEPIRVHLLINSTESVTGTTTRKIQ